jgi:hypothetical protein
MSGGEYSDQAEVRSDLVLTVQPARPSFWRGWREEVVQGPTLAAIDQAWDRVRRGEAEYAIISIEGRGFLQYDGTVLEHGHDDRVYRLVLGRERIRRETSQFITAARLTLEADWEDVTDEVFSAKPRYWKLVVWCVLLALAVCLFVGLFVFLALKSWHMI